MNYILEKLPQLVSKKIFCRSRNLNGKGSWKVVVKVHMLSDSLMEEERRSGYKEESVFSEFTLNDKAT